MGSTVVLTDNEKTEHPVLPGGIREGFLPESAGSWSWSATEDQEVRPAWARWEWEGD